MFLWASDCIADIGNVSTRNYLVAFVAVFFQFSCSLELIVLLMLGNFAKLDFPPPLAARLILSTNPKTLFLPRGFSVLRHVCIWSGKGGTVARVTLRPQRNAIKMLRRSPSLGYRVGTMGNMSINSCQWRIVLLIELVSLAQNYELIV